MIEDEKTIEKEIKDIQTTLFLCIPILLFSIAIPIAAYNSFLIPINGLPTTWFQRSGSLVVLFAAWSEYHLITINEEVNPSGRVTSQQSYISNKFRNLYKIIQTITLFIAVIGTFICGYGDLLK